MSTSTVKSPSTQFETISECGRCAPVIGFGQKLTLFSCETEYNTQLKNITAQSKIMHKIYFGLDSKLGKEFTSCIQYKNFFLSVINYTCVFS